LWNQQKFFKIVVKFRRFYASKGPLLAPKWAFLAAPFDQLFHRFRTVEKSELPARFG